MKYSTKKNILDFGSLGTSTSYELYLEEPYDYLSLLSADEQSSILINKYIQGINAVVNNTSTFYTFGNQSGILINVDSTGCHVFDEYDDEYRDTEMYCVPQADMLQLLTDYRDFLVANGM